MPPAKATLQGLIPGGIKIERNSYGKPPLGALEVLVNDFLLYSKTKTGRWPNAQILKERLKRFTDGEDLNFYDE